MSKKITQFFKPQPSLSKKVGEFDRIKEDKKILFSKSCPNFYIAPIKLFWRKSVGGIYIKKNSFCNFYKYIYKRNSKIR